MEKITALLEKLSNQVDKAAICLSVLYAFVSTVVVLSSVFLRMVGHAPSWSEEFARWLIIAIAFVSSSVALKKGMHIGITSLIKRIKNRYLTILLIQITNLSVLFFLVLLFWTGFDAAIKAVDQTGDIIPISVVYVKLHLPLGALMMAVHIVYYIFGVMCCDEPKKFLLSQ